MIFVDEAQPAVARLAVGTGELARDLERRHDRDDDAVGVLGERDEHRAIADAIRVRRANGDRVAAGAQAIRVERPVVLARRLDAALVPVDAVDRDLHAGDRLAVGADHGAGERRLGLQPQLGPVGGVAVPARGRVAIRAGAD